MKKAEIERAFEPLLHSWEIVGAAALLSLLNYALRIHRWRGYLMRLGHTVSLGFTVPTYIAGSASTGPLLGPGLRHRRSAAVESPWR